MEDTALQLKCFECIVHLSEGETNKKTIVETTLRMKLFMTVLASLLIL